MGKTLNAAIAHRLRLSSKKRSFSKHALVRFSQRYDIDLSREDLLRMGEKIRRGEFGSVIGVQSDGRRKYRVTYKGRLIFLIYDPIVRSIVTALPSEKYFKKIKLLESDKEDFLSGKRTVIFHIDDDIVAMKKDYILDLYVTSDEKPFARVTLKSMHRKILLDLVGKYSEEGLNFKTLDETLMYFVDRYGVSITSHTSFKVCTINTIEIL